MNCDFITPDMSVITKQKNKSVLAKDQKILICAALNEQKFKDKIKYRIKYDTENLSIFKGFCSLKKEMMNSSV